MIELHNDDCLKILKDMPDNSVTAIVTDPPYGLSKQPDISEVMKHWVNENYKDVNSSGGFMGKKWDSFVPSPEIWKEVYRVLKPGGTALVFAGTRTQDLMAISLRFAGFHIKDTLMFLFGSGFPKAADIGKNVDNKLGNEREVVGKRKHPTLKDTNKLEESANAAHGNNLWGREWDITAPASEEAAKWEGYKSHGLKPAYEPILLAMKPNDGSYADNALKHGIAGLNVEKSRVGTAGGETHTGGFGSGIYGNSKGVNTDKTKLKGRFPANIILSYPEDEYVLKDGITPEQLIKLGEWLNANAEL